MSKSLNSKKLITFLAFFILLSDQVSKWLVINSMTLGESHYVFPFFNIVMVKNNGITFGMLRGAIPSAALILIAVIVMIFVFIWASRNRHYMLPAALIISGAIGNIIDRIVYGAVIDFLDFHLCGYHWPAFNIADSAIVIGAAILFFISFGEKT
jgi:signal peptidase II